MASKKTAKPKAAAKAAKASKAKEPKAAKGKRPTKAQLAAMKDEAEANPGRKLPGANAIKKLRNDVQILMDRGKTETAAGRQLISEAVKSMALNAKAFDVVRKEYIMSKRDPAAHATYLQDTKYYREIFGISESSMPTLFEATPEGPVQEDDEDDGAETNSADDTPDEDAPPPADEFDQSGNVHRIGRGQAA